MGNEGRVQTEQSKGDRGVVVYGKELVLQFTKEREAELHQELVSTLQEALKVLEEVLEGEDMDTESHKPLLTIGGGVHTVLYQMC